jgi:hypothetical protein
MRELGFFAGRFVGSLFSLFEAILARPLVAIVLMLLVGFVMFQSCFARPAPASQPSSGTERGSVPTTPVAGRTAAVAQAQASPTARAPAPTQVAAGPAKTPVPTRVAAAATSNRYVRVANTGGIGVYLRNSPAMADRSVAWPDGTRFLIVGADTYAEGRLWRRVQDPRSRVGWVPAQYVVDVP